MSLSPIVDIQISTDSPPVARAGFGVPLIFGYHDEYADLVRFYGKIADVAEDFATDHPIYRAANAMFAQDPAPARIAIGRRQTATTFSVEITPTAADDTTYTVTIDGTPFAFTSGSSATAQDVCDGLKALINGGSFDVTAATVGEGAAAKLTIEADNAGDWFGIEVGSRLALSDKTPATGITDDLNAIRVENDTWYALASIGRSKAEIEAIAAWCESAKKLFVVASNDSAVTGSGSTDVASTVKASGYAYTSVSYHHAPGEFMDAAWLGRCLPLDPGSETWKFKTLKGVSAGRFTATELVNLRAKNANWYQTLAGKSITMGGGKVAADEFIDVVRGLDWLEARIEEDVFQCLVDVPKLPYTNAGAMVIQGVVQARLDNGVSVGLLSDDPAPVASVPRVADVPTEDRAARTLPGVSFTGVLAGAIHHVVIRGSVTVG